MSHLEKDVELLETAIEDIEEEIEEIIDFIDPMPEGENGVEDGEGAKANGKIEKAKKQLTELLDLIKGMKRDDRDNHTYGRAEKGKKTRISMMEDIDRLKEELDAMQEDKEMMEEKLYEQGIKIRRLMEDNKELKKGGDGAVTATAARGSAAGKARVDSESETDDSLKDSRNSITSEEDDDTSGSDSDVHHGSRPRLSPSQRIDNIIKRQTATLDDLFSKEDLHEELTSRYGSRDHNLMAFFSRPTILTALIDTIVNIPPVTQEETGEKEIPPVPYTASEILISGIQPLTDMLCQPSNLQKCFSLLDRPAPLPGSSPIASLWYKVMSHLLSVKSMELSVYIKDHNILPKVVNHISSECVLNLLLTMLNTEAKLETYGDEFQWSHLQLIELLAAKLDACAIVEATSADYPNISHHTTALDNISEFLCEILTKYPFTSPLVLQMQETPFVKRLVRNCFVIYPSENDIGVVAPMGESATNALYASRLRGPVHCLQILGHILSLSVNGGNYADIEMPPVITELLNDANPVDNIPAPLHSIAAIIRSFTQDLLEPDVVNSKKGNKNKILLGEYRMRVLMVAVGLARTGFFWSDHALLEAGILHSIFTLFFTFPWNNVVHTMVTELVVSLLPPQSPLSRAGFCLVVLKDLRFLDSLIQISKKYENTGLLGHLATLTTAIQRAASSTPSIQDCVSECKEEWSVLLAKMSNFNDVTWKAN